MFPRLALATLVAATVVVNVVAADHRVLTDRSSLAIVTHKGGFAPGAHDHLVSAEDWSASLAFDPTNPAATRCDVTVPVASLVFDDPERQAAWYPTIEALGLLDEPFTSPSAKERGKIRDTALGSSQLDIESFPHIEATLAGVAPATNDLEMPWRARVRIEVHGTPVEREVRARFEVAKDGTVTFDAHGAFRFSEFGIKPYSAFLGAVKNRDEFDLLVRIVASPVAALPAAP